MKKPFVVTSRVIAHLGESLINFSKVLFDLDVSGGESCSKRLFFKPGRQN